MGWPIHRIYVCGDDSEGWLTGIFYDKKLANDYFLDARKRYPKADILTEKLDDDTGDIISQKWFRRNEGGYLETNEVKSMRQETVKLIRYDIEWAEKKMVAQGLSPDEAGQMMIDAIGSDGYGTKWMYIVEHDSFVSEAEGIFEIPKGFTMKI